MPECLPIDAIRSAALAIAPHVLRTPLLRAPVLEERWNAPAGVYLKCENFQRTRSFKERGATAALAARLFEVRPKGVVARSSGNFATALARAGKLLQVPVTVVMPTHAPQVKIAQTRMWGAEVVLHGTTHPEGQARADAIARGQGCPVFQAYDDIDVMCGQGTVGLEVVEDLPGIEHFFAPVGGGGLAGGSAAAIMQLAPRAACIAVEPACSPDYATSRACGARTVVLPQTSIADGLQAPAVGERNWPVLQRYVSEVQEVSESAIVEAMRLCYAKLGIILEPSGAVALAGLAAWAMTGRLQGPAVCVLSGANVDMGRFFELVGGIHAA